MKIKQISFTRYVAVLLVAFGITMPTLADVCKNVTFRAHNTTGTDMKIYSVRYRDYSSGNTEALQEEYLPAINCAHGSDCFSDPQNLGSAFEPRENHNLANFSFKYAYWTTTGWGPKKWSSERYNSNMTCTNGRTYGTFNVP